MEPQEPEKTFTSAERIQQLNSIDKDVAKLLNSAGLAIRALTNNPSSEETSPSSLEGRQAAFKAATAEYFALLSSIDVRLRRQVYALEEASIIQSESTSRGGENAPGTGTTATGGSGVNPLDISWLNSRKDTVGKDKEAEIWAEASKFVMRLNSANTDGDPATGNQEKMEVD